MSYSVGSGGSAWALHLSASPPTSYGCPSLEAWWILATWGGDRQARHDAHQLLTAPDPGFPQVGFCGQRLQAAGPGTRSSPLGIG